MWLRRLVGVVLIVTLIGMNVVAVMGLFVPDKKPKIAVDASSVVQQVLSEKPTVSLTADPGTITAGTTTALTWTTTGSPTTCTAASTTGTWQGVKTPFGAESSGRISNPGNYTYTLTCVNQAGSAEATATVAVSKSPVVAAKPSTAKSAPSPAGSAYCKGRVPCYGVKDVAAHGAKGNCWGWLGDRVINISSFDASFHVTRSGISSVELSSVCGKDISPSVNGQVSAGEYTSGHEHNLGAKSSADKNYLPYFVGYFDNTKP